MKISKLGGKRILPVIYSGNYFTLMPGERRSIVMEVQNADKKGEGPEIAVEGLNVE